MGIDLFLVAFADQICFNSRRALPTGGMVFEETRGMRAIMSLWRHGDLITTQDGSLTVKDPIVGECYHSQMGARREARELYIEASGLAERWNKPDVNGGTSPLEILDVGLGLGYNAMATIEAWMSSPNVGSLLLQSLEVDQDLVALLASGQAPWQQGWDQILLDAVGSLKSQTDSIWTTQIKHPISSAICSWTIRIGDASNLAVKPMSSRGFDYIWQDPFSPEKNPKMWTSDWFRKLRPGTHPQTLLMTYSVARAVRDHLTEGGWVWEKFPSNSGIKRHWLRAKPA
jgi:tRNA U34 5-methylaminomethyl-2-thiouridine-forming methyltransferase MnmC